MIFILDRGNVSNQSVLVRFIVIMRERERERVVGDRNYGEMLSFVAELLISVRIAKVMFSGMFRQPQRWILS